MRKPIFINNHFKRSLALVLTFLFIFSAAVIPNNITASATYLDERIFDFEDISGTVYGNGATAKDSKGTVRSVSSVGFTRTQDIDNGYLSLTDTRGSRNARDTYFIFNDNKGIYELKEGASYIVSLRFKVASNQVSFNYNGVSYPRSDQNTSVKLVYGSKTTTEIGDIALLSTGGTTFTRTDEKGDIITLPVGEWHSVSFSFTAPASFADGENFVALSASTFNGADIQFDDVTFARVPSIKLVTSKGTLDKTTIPVKIGDKFDIPNPKLSTGINDYTNFGTDFLGWFYDSACTKPFTDEYVTEENCELTLYAGFSEEVFGFESYSRPNDSTAPNNFFSIRENPDIAYSGRNYMHYHFTEEYWNNLHTDGNAYRSRRESAENRISLKKINPSTTYVLTFKYYFPEGSGDVKVRPSRRAKNIWWSGTNVNLSEEVVLYSKNSQVWQEYRTVFTTDESLIGGTNSNYDCSYLYLMVYAAEDVHTEVYIDEVTVREVKDTTEIKLEANGGAFDNGKTSFTQKATVGDEVALFPIPQREGYDFAGWAFDKNCEETVTSKTVDASVYQNTLYAVWTKNMSFEAYYYDLDSSNRNNYISETVDIVKENAKSGIYSAKLTANSGNQNVIALNPTDNNTCFLVTFYYDLKSATDDVNISFASMGYNINNSDEAKIYDSTYTISKEDAGKGYKMGALVIDTEFLKSDANRLAMLVSGKSGEYTVYFDCVETKALTASDGYMLFADIISGDYTVEIGKNGKIVEPRVPQNDAHKFIGWYKDSALTEIYENDFVYSLDYNVIYTGFIKAETFDNYTVNGTNSAVAQEQNNKYLQLSGNATEKIYSATATKRYGVEFNYCVMSMTANTTLKVGNNTLNIEVSEGLDSNWKKQYMVITADSDALNISVESNSDLVLGIDNVVVYEIDERMSVITFDQKDGYGEDTVRVGIKGTQISMPSVIDNATEVFYGWYEDSSLKTPFVSKVYPQDDITVYGRWAKNPVTIVNFDNVKSKDYLTSSNSANVYASTGQKFDGQNCFVFDKTAQGEYDIYSPLYNENGYVKLESNTTYAVSYYSYYAAYTTSAKMTIAFFTSSSDKFENENKVSEDQLIRHSYSYTPGYMYIQTGDLTDSNNTLYIKVLSGTAKTTMRLDAIRITRIDENRNHIFLYDDKNTALYEVDANYGEKIDYPNIETNQFVVEGWYDTVDLINKYDAGVHKSEAITELFCRWELAPISFENYYYENSKSKYSVGDDVSLSSEERYDTARSLKYSYNYAVKYFETTNNTAGIGKVNDNSTYKITFKYKITVAQGDVDIKFLTAHLNNRWAFITNYDEANYRIYSSEIGNGWQEATVYLTTKFESSGASALFMTFNPVKEGATVVYIDAFELEYLGPSAAVAAFVGKDGNVVHYEIGQAGDSVSTPDVIPASQFAAFKGWYNDEECTEKSTSLTLSTGTNFIYSGWTEKAEKFDNYAYASKDNNNYSQNNQIVDSVLTYTSQNNNSKVANGFRIGKLENNTSYKICFKYKTESNGAVIKFATADEMNIGINTTAYNDEGNFVKTNADGLWKEATVYLTTAFTYTVPKDNNINSVENKNAEYGDMLYMYFEHSENAQICIDDISVTEVNVIYQNGYSVLTEQASEIAGSQAMRFYFSYPTQNVISISIDGQMYNVVERGIVFKNARNTATGQIVENKVIVKPILLEYKNDKGFTYVSKTNGFNQYWDYDNKTERVVFSAYVKDFNLEDTRMVGARGYIKVKDEQGNIYTFYSADKKTTVKEGVNVNSEITTVKNHTFASVEWDNFTIVNPKLMPYIYGSQIEDLIEYAKEAHNVDLVRVTEKAAETEYEIIIGDTIRDASDLLSVENEDQYVIAVRGTKLIIKGGSDLATRQGVKDFIEYLKLKDSLNCGANLNDGYTIYGNVSKTADDYKLTFNDDFEGSTLNANYWGAYRNEGVNSTSTTYSQFDGKISVRPPFDPGYTTYTGKVVEKPTFVRDGNAVMTIARLENGKDFITSRMSTFWNMIFQYGIVEFNVKLAPHPVHTSLWMNGASTDSSSFLNLFDREFRGAMTEYDLLENYGIVNNYASAIHHWWNATSVRDKAHVSLDDSYGIGTKDQDYTPDKDEVNIYDNYHIFSFVWGDDGLKFAFDGVKYYEMPVYDTYFERMANYIIIGTGMANRDYGSSYDPKVDSDYYELLIDYVRIYQMENMGSRMMWAK